MQHALRIWLGIAVVAAWPTLERPAIAEEDMIGGGIAVEKTPGAEMAATISSAMPPAMTPHLLMPVLNGVIGDQAIIVFTDGDDILLPLDYLREQQVATPAKARAARPGYIATRQIPGLEARLDVDEGRIEIACGASCFSPMSLSLRSAGPSPAEPAAVGAFFNYDVSLQAGEGADSWGTIGEVGLFNRFGTGMFDFTCAEHVVGATCIRLESNWTIDQPSRMRRLRLGDAVTQAAAWGSPVRFAGVKWGTDFSLRPGFITFPTPQFSGSAEVPSTVDVFINDNQRFQGGLPAGPFTINDIPVVTGSGQARVVVTDLLGRETVLSASYYVSPRLLKPGLDRFSLEAGAVRDAYAVRSFSYGQAFAAGSYMRGVADWLTVEARAEIGSKQQSLGAGVSVAQTGLGAATLSAALAHGDVGAGARVGVTHEWRGTEFSTGVGFDYTTRDFRRFGLPDDRTEPRLTARASLVRQWRRYGTLSINALRRDNRDAEDFHSLGASYNKSFGVMTVSLTGLRLLAPEGRTIVTLSLTMPLGGHTSASAGTEFDGSQWGAFAQLRRARDGDRGWAYDARAAVDGVDRIDAGVSYNGDIGVVEARASQVEGRSVGRLVARGGIGYLGGNIYAMPPVNGSFAVVSVGNEGGIAVRRDGRLAGATDRHGRLLITGLRAYETNTLSFRPEDVPLAASVGATKRVIVPQYRTGYLIAFDVVRQYNLIAHLRLENGAAVPAGARVRLVESGETVPVGLDGRVFLSVARLPERILYGSGTRQCEAIVPVTEFSDHEPIHDIGTLTCQPNSTAMNDAQNY